MIAGLLYISQSRALERATSGRLRVRATDFISREFLRLKRDRFLLLRPDGQEVARGHDARGFVTLLHGIYKKATGIDVFNDLDVDFGLLSGIRAVRAIGTIWDRSRSLTELLRIFLGPSDYPFQLQMVLMLLCPSEVWAQRELELSRNSRHYLSMLLYAKYHNTWIMTATWREARNLLIACSADGPSNNERVWNKDNLWVRGGPGSPSDDMKEQFNGLDYMVMHNLGQIIYERSILRP